MRWRVLKVFHDDGAFGYTAPPIEEVVKDWLTRAEAKSIYRHLSKKYWYNEWISIELEVMYDGNWENVSQPWSYREVTEQEEWFERRGFDYTWWLYSGEVKKIG